MAKKNAIGLKALLIGDIAVDGGAGTTLTELVGDTVRGTASLTSTTVESTPILIEESDDPIMNIITGGGIFSFVWSSYNLDPDVLVQFFGGSVTGTAPNKIWAAPDLIPNIEKTVQGETANGIVAKAARVQISAEMALNFQKETPGQINFVGTVLKPTKVDEPKLTIGTPAP